MYVSTIVPNEPCHETPVDVLPLPALAQSPPPVVHYQHDQSVCDSTQSSLWSFIYDSVKPLMIPHIHGLCVLLVIYICYLQLWGWLLVGYHINHFDIYVSLKFIGNAATVIANIIWEFVRLENLVKNECSTEVPACNIFFYCHVVKQFSKQIIRDKVFQMPMAISIIVIILTIHVQWLT